jgi:hypothetical protein
VLLSVRVAPDDPGHSEATAEPAQQTPPPRPRRPRPPELLGPPRYFWFPY